MQSLAPEFAYAAGVAIKKNESRLAPMFISERYGWFICADGKGGESAQVAWGPPGPSGSSSPGAAAGGVLTPTLCLLPLQLLSKYDPQKEAELRSWIEGLTGLSIGPDFQKGLKDGIILCT